MHRFTVRAETPLRLHGMNLAWISGLVLALVFLSVGMVWAGMNPDELKRYVDQRLTTMQQAIETCDQAAYDQARDELVQALKAREQAVDKDIAAIRKRQAVPASVDTPQEAHDLVAAEKPKASGKGKAMEAKAGKLKDLQAMAVLLQEKQSMQEIEHKAVYPNYPSPCVKTVPVSPAPVKEQPQAAPVTPAGQPQAVPVSPAGQPQASPESPTGQPEQAMPAPGMEPHAAKPGAEGEPTATMQEVPAKAPVEAMVAPGATVVPAGGDAGVGLLVDGGLFFANLPQAGYGTVAGGGTESFLGQSEDDVEGYTLGLGLLVPVGEVRVTPGTVKAPSLLFSARFSQADGDAEAAVPAGVDPVSVALQQDFGGASVIDLGTSGLELDSDTTFHRTSLEAAYVHPCFQKNTALGAFNWLGMLGVGYSLSKTDQESEVTSPTLAGFSSSWDQEMDEQFTYLKIGTGFELWPTDRVWLKVLGALKPGYRDVDLDSRQHVVNPGAAAPLDDFILSNGDGDHGYTWGAEVSAEIGLLISQAYNFSIKAGILGDYLHDTADVDNRQTALDGAMELDKDSLSSWAALIGLQMEF